MLQLLLSSPLSPLLRSSAASIGFTPYVLFAGGQQGAWFEPSSAIAAPWYQDSAATTPITGVEQVIGNARDKSGNGNHALQATGPARPVLSARVNLLTKSEQFDDAAWMKTDAVVTADQATAPNGTLTADGISFNAAGATVAQRLSTEASTTYTFSVWLWVVSGTFKLKLSRTNTASWTTATTGPEITLTTTPTRFDLTFTTLAGETLSDVLFGAEGKTPYNLPATGPILAWGAQLELWSVATRYQRVNTATDYDTAGFPSYEKSDGIDDNSTSATGGGGTAGFFWCRGTKINGGAGTVRRLFDDRVPASFTGRSVQINASNQLEVSIGNGTAYTTIATAATVDVSSTYVLTARDNGTNLSVQINNGAVASVARPAAAAGTAQFTRMKDNNAASGFSNANGYAELYFRDSGLTDAQAAQSRQYVAQQSGVTL